MYSKGELELTRLVIDTKEPAPGVTIAKNHSARHLLLDYFGASVATDRDLGHSVPPYKKTVTSLEPSQLLTILIPPRGPIMTESRKMPAWHESDCVQALPSLHEVPFAAAGFVHVPVAGLHVPATWHWSDDVQTTGLVPVHTPAWQASLWVHALPSLHDAPLAAAGFEHAPFEGSQVPATWHWSKAVQVTGLLPVQTPAWHESVCVHALPSLHDVPFAAEGFEHVPVAGLLPKVSPPLRGGPPMGVSSFRRNGACA